MNLNTNKKNKIKLVIYLIIVMVMGTIAPFFPSSSEFKAAGTGSLVDWYGLWGSDIRFDSNTQLLTFVTKAKKAASNSSVRFNTIGWQVRFEPTDGSPNFYTRTKPYFTRLHDNVEGGVTYVYSEWVIPLAPHPDYSGSILECLVRDYGNMGYTMDSFVTMLSHGAVLKFDSIVSILESNTMEPNAYVDENGNIQSNSKAPVASRRGEYYLTKTGSTYATNHHIKSGWTAISNYDMSKGGIAGARTWSNTAMFDDLFDKPAYIQIEEVLLPKTVKTSHFTTTGVKLAPIQIVETVELKKGETVDVTVTGLSFPGYKIHHSAFNYKGTGSADSKDTQYGDSSITRTIPVTTDNVEHYIYFYYEKVTDIPDPTPTGTIIFTPNESKVIPNNNNGWVKDDISVTVTVANENKKVKTTDSEYRDYSWWDPYYKEGDPDCSQIGADGEPICVPTYIGDYDDSSSLCTFEQTWQVKDLYVTGTGKTKDNASVNIGPFIIPDGGSIIIDKELKDIILTAKVNEWESLNDQTFICGSAPQGSWDES